MDTHFINNDANPIETNQVMWMNHIQSLNPEQLVNLLTQLEDMWDIPRKNDEAVSFQLGFKNFFAVLSPTPGNPGILSTESPFIAKKSMT